MGFRTNSFAVMRNPLSEEVTISSMECHATWGLRVGSGNSEEEWPVKSFASSGSQLINSNTSAWDLGQIVEKKYFISYCCHTLLCYPRDLQIQWAIEGGILSKRDSHDRCMKMESKHFARTISSGARPSRCTGSKERYRSPVAFGVCTTQLRT